MEVWTDPSHVRESAKDLDRFDPNNFAKAIKKTKGLPKRKDWHLKLNKPDWEAAIELVKEMAESE